ncbi:hypothetical protein GTE47_003783 [Salmonella enterica subsp. enterica]|uniref:Uncharacterized protein n=3 Tax=Salmonella enterica TaxID=28901 RepID=A0A636VS04_SALER|nr:hypothetical protein [Salmonella enterica]EBF8393616.1 hypothetical protein [Salmonella enterica subsp. enterica serovar Corvallis]ECZ3652937.1 hypothetical protein [Salmonella enterica subsp. enterica serovar Chailey]EDP8984671.1 hypothetical protein [Salmonella enterica subsp. enterica]EDQ4688399.1 hypothetical protein [Salmonella enterica subsp. enterica serovar Stanleyville]
MKLTNVKFISPFSCSRLRPASTPVSLLFYRALYRPRFPASPAVARMVIFRAAMQETHSTIHTCILPLPS